MMCITDSLTPWPDVEKKHGRFSTLLIGNGSSLAVWPKFGYKTLLGCAKAALPDSGRLGDDEQRLFEELATTNFESVLSSLTTTIKVSGIFGLSTGIDRLKKSYKCIKKGLVCAVRNVHIGFGDLDGVRKKTLRDAFLQYEYVYTTNYDLILYWSLMFEPDPPAGIRMRDYFWNNSPSDDLCFDATNTAVKADSDKLTKVVFLHGALHLFRSLIDGRTFKRKSKPGINLLDQFDFSMTEVPLFISEGTAKDKLTAIMRNDYLSFGLRQLSLQPGAMVVFGHSLSQEFDGHLIQALNNRWDHVNHDERVIALSVLPGSDGSAIINFKNRLTDSLPGYKLEFFDALSHPLGSKDLLVPTM